MPQKLLIVGALARAAAWSAVRAGYSVVAADLFADRDLRELCTVHRIDAYPEQLESIARQSPPGPWMYTGRWRITPRLSIGSPAHGACGATQARRCATFDIR